MDLSLWLHGAQEAGQDKSTCHIPPFMSNFRKCKVIYKGIRVVPMVGEGREVQEKRDSEEDPGNSWGWWKCSLSWMGRGLHRAHAATHTQKLTTVHTLNRRRYFNWSISKLWDPSVFPPSIIYNRVLVTGVQKPPLGTMLLGLGCLHSGVLVIWACFLFLWLPLWGY